MEMKPNGNLPDSVAGARDDLMSMLRRLDREEILEALSDGVCDHCQAGLQIRISNFLNKKRSDMSPSESSDNSPESSLEFCSAKSSNGSLESSTQSSTSWGSMKTPRAVYFGMKNVGAVNYSPASVNNKQPLSDRLGSDISEEEKKAFAQVGRKKDFVHTEKVNGKQKNVLQGLELHTRVFSAEEQKKIVECVYNLQRMGQKGQLRERTYSEPSKWMRGKGRITIQFGCCYNYAVDKQGNPPGIIRDKEVDPLPPLFKEMIRKMVKWHVLPPTCVPNSCIVNIYEAGDCIPPHIDHHDFLRPFCTVSFLTECNILFGSNLKIVGPGEFAGPVSIPLPVGSVLILNGNGADVAKHCVPGVPAKRISITFRKMDDSKLPYRFSTDPELQGTRPIGYTPLNHSPAGPPQQNQQHENNKVSPQPFPGTSNNKSFVMEKEEFPALGGGSKSSNRQWGNKNGLKY